MHGTHSTIPIKKSRKSFFVTEWLRAPGGAPGPFAGFGKTRGFIYIERDSQENGGFFYSEQNREKDRFSARFEGKKLDKEIKVKKLNGIDEFLYSAKSLSLKVKAFP